MELKKVVALYFKSSLIEAVLNNLANSSKKTAITGSSLPDNFL